MTQVFMWSAKLAYVHGHESDSTIRKYNREFTTIRENIL